MDLIQQQENLETLGQRLKTIRELRGMTPLKLAAEMESSLTSIRDWESGARKLQPATIRRLAQALQLSYPEEMYWLGLAGHLPATTMPAQNQIVEALAAYYADLVKLPYPAQIIDHHFAYWMVNPATIEFLGARDALVTLMQQKLTVFDVVFNSQIGFLQRASRAADIIARQKQLMRRIVGRSLHRRHERFFQEFPAWLQPRLPEDDYQQFALIWDEINSVQQFQQPHLEDDIMLRYFDFQYPDGRQRRLQMRTDHIRYFGDLFEIIIFYPYEAEAEGLFQPQAQAGVKLWDVTDVGKLMRGYE